MQYGGNKELSGTVCVPGPRVPQIHEAKDLDRELHEPLLTRKVNVKDIVKSITKLSYDLEHGFSVTQA